MTDHNDYNRGKVSRLPPMPIPPDPITREMFDEQISRGGHIINMHLVNAHAPKLARARRGVTKALRDDCKVSRKIREMVIVRTAALVEQPYELRHHYPLALKSGWTHEQIEAIKGDWQTSGELLDTASRDVLAYVDRLCLYRGDIPDNVFEAFSRHFSPQEILEITHTANSYWATGVFIRAMKIELDPEDRTTAPGKF